MKRKIGIVTMINDNMGNRLQNYAIQEIYRDLGFKAVTLGRYAGKGRDFTNKLGLKFRNYYSFLKGVLKSKIRHKSNGYYIASFNKHIRFSHRPTQQLRDPRLSQRYDYFSIGSDQVWNPRLAFLQDVDLLKFSPKQKNIAMAASIGLDSLEGECDLKSAKEGFLNFAHISVRENRAKEIVEEISGRDDVEVFLDPTLILPREKWQKVEGGGRTKRKYIFMYFLSEANREVRLQIYAFAKENGFEVLEWEGGLSLKSGPSEWLSLIHHASYVCTDSFHACAFSLNFNVPFTVFQRDFCGGMYSRITTLKDRFCLEGIEYDGQIRIPKIDFSRTNAALQAERARVYKTLREWLK